jgi:tRNA pseudouridine38-40 synthase
MVRNLMGCLVYIGRGRRPVEWMAEVLASRDREVAAPTFMPDGLYLAQVGYPEQFAVPAPQTGSVPWSTVWTEQAQT